jgi:predicted dehydrogenase
VKLGVAIVGCGLIGIKRADTLDDMVLRVSVDVDPVKAEALASRFPGCRPMTDWRDAVNDKQVNVVIVSTPHNSLAEIMAGAIAAGCHVLVEKPAARFMAELDPLITMAKRQNVLVRVGFNHRCHRSFQKMREIVDAGEIGELMFLRARYGHGGRLGYEQEWRAQPALSGGGELIDQGVHLIDLARWFLGDFLEVDGFAHTYYWDMPVDDNAFMLLKTEDQRTAFLHVSCTEWKNTFCFELYGHNGKLQVDGLGGSYGVERLTWYKMLPEMGPPETLSWEYPMRDNSWQVEMNQFRQDIELGRQPQPGLIDAVAVLQIVESLYEKSGYDHRP